MFDAISKRLAPLAVRVSNLVSRGVVKIVNDATKLQGLQLVLLSGEVRSDVERFQNYGLTSVPLAGAEAVTVFVGGKRDHGLAIAVDDRRYRIKGLAGGEVAVYNHTGAKVVFKANGDIEVSPKAGQKTKITGDVSVTGTLTASVDVVANGKSLNAHTHPVTGTAGTNPVVFVPPGSTGAPT